MRKICSPCCETQSCYCLNYQQWPSGTLYISGCDGQYGWLDGIKTTLQRFSNNYYTPTGLTNFRYLGVFAADYPSGNDIIPTGYSTDYIDFDASLTNGLNSARLDTLCHPFWLAELKCVSGKQTLSFNNNTYNGSLGFKAGYCPYHINFESNDYGCGDNFYSNFSGQSLTSIFPETINDSGNINITITKEQSFFVLTPSSYYQDLFYYKSDFSSFQELNYVPQLTGYFLATGQYTYFHSFNTNPFSTGSLNNLLVSFINTPDKPSTKYDEIPAVDYGSSLSNNYVEWRYSASYNGYSPNVYKLFNNHINYYTYDNTPWPVANREHIYLPLLGTDSDIGEGFFSTNSNIESIPMRYMDLIDDCNFPIATGVYCSINGQEFDFIHKTLNNRWLTYWFKYTLPVLSGTFGGGGLNSVVYAGIKFGTFCSRTFEVELYSEHIITCQGVEHLARFDNIIINQNTPNTNYVAECDPFLFYCNSSGSFRDLLSINIWGFGSNYIQTFPNTCNCIQLWGCGPLYESYTSGSCFSCDLHAPDSSGIYNYTGALVFTNPDTTNGGFFSLNANIIPSYTIELSL
jgi:hypothetical protein